MINDSLTVEETRLHLGIALKEKDFVIDKTGVKTIEIIGASFVADEPFILALLMMNTFSVNLNGINLRACSLKIFQVKHRRFGSR